LGSLCWVCFFFFLLSWVPGYTLAFSSPRPVDPPPPVTFGGFFSESTVLLSSCSRVSLGLLRDDSLCAWHLGRCFLSTFSPLMFLVGPSLWLGFCLERTPSFISVFVAFSHLVDPFSDFARPVVNSLVHAFPCCRLYSHVDFF